MNGRGAHPALLALGLAAVGLVALGLDRLGGRGGLPNLEALPEVARPLRAAQLLFAVCGAAPVARALPARLREDALLLVLPVGAVLSGLALTVLGVFGVPLPASLAVVLCAGAGGALVEARRGGLRRPALSPDSRTLALSALVVGAAIVAIALSPLARDDSFATVFGQNGDAHLATGAATLLQNAGPAEVAPELPVDRMPGAWRSKYPIYYTFAAVSSLSGLDPIQSFIALSALMLALAALGFLLLARHMLGAGTTAALAAMALVGLGEQALTLVHSPFYNQLWGSFALPFTLLATWLFMREPGRAELALALPFFAVGFLAYPLLAPFTAAFAILCGVLVLRRRRAAGGSPGWIAALELPRGRGWIPVYAVGGAVGLVFSVAVAAAGAEKIVDGVRAALPGGDLGPWSGDALGFLALDRALGVSSVSIVVPIVLGAAIYVLARREREVSIPLAATVAALFLAGLYLRLRGEGELFVFKALSFAGLIVVALGAVGMVELATSKTRAVRIGGITALVLVGVGVGLSTRLETRSTDPHVTRDIAALKGWSADLPRGASVRVDVKQYGMQQWAWYMLADRPVSSLNPLLDFFPHAPVGRKADYLLVDAPGARPRDAAGPALVSNASFELYRMRADVPGPDVSSRRMIDPFVPEDLERPGAVRLPG